MGDAKKERSNHISSICDADILNSHVEDISVGIYQKVSTFLKDQAAVPRALSL
jgi:hypothetical protein